MTSSEQGCKCDLNDKIKKLELNEGDILIVHNDLRGQFPIKDFVLGFRVPVIYTNDMEKIRVDKVTAISRNGVDI